MPRPRRLRPFTHRAFACVLIGTVCYSLWIAQPWFNPAMPLWRSYVSELAAINQPGNAIVRVGDTLAAICAACAGLFGWRSRAFTRPACAMIAVFALATVLDSIFPMACAPSLSAVCAAGDEAGTLGLSHNIHTMTSAVANMATLGLTGWWLWCHRRRPQAREAVAHLTALTHIVTALVTAGLALVHSEAAGVFQRVSLIGLIVWVLVAVSLRSESLRSRA
ncbi:DUF998 domain-containing protein [Nanchangia anserum]|uniref:DUF998 domain-containing protein n=1 Tax=Nanchangia anserum TaxID=2692125 RepID=A0A8I0G7T2_9ACTO|nr:DUF998 domain-containing protein [Nanchangia anserum]MBD3689432.1 DUF998 domain-containing protein [Nanchangia anserum]QOX81636.1 DUF998 domain-containing protein [Nanchangia anserum]